MSNFLRVRKGSGTILPRQALRLAWRPQAAGLTDPAFRSALPGVAFVPYAGAVPDGRRHGLQAAVTVTSPHRLVA